MKVLLRTALNNPAVMVGAVITCWGLSEYFMIMTGKRLNWQTGLFFNCLGVITVNLYTMRNETLQIFNLDISCVFTILTGVLYSIADIFFLKLSGNTHVGHLADVSVLAPLCALYILIPTILGILLDVSPVHL